MGRPEINRRKLITGLSAIICAPAIVRASSLMPVRAWKPVIDAKLFRLYELQYKLMGIEMPLEFISVTGSIYEPYTGIWAATWQ